VAKKLVKVVAAIPTGHRHLRMVLFFDDGEVVVLTEALAAGLTRAYIDVVAHPTRRGLSSASRRCRASRATPRPSWWSAGAKKRR